MDQNLLNFWKNYENVINWGYNITGARKNTSSESTSSLETGINSNATFIKEKCEDVYSSDGSDDIDLKYLEFFKKTLEHQEKIGKEKRKVDKEYGFCNSPSSENESVLTVSLEEVKPTELYGSKADEIACLESNLLSEFTTFNLLKKPTVWPCIALNLVAPGVKYKTHEATSEINFNRVGGVITFEIEGSDSFLNVKGAKYIINGKYLKQDNTEYKTKSNVKLDDNFIGFLFSHIEVTKNGPVIDQIENVGRASTIKGWVSYSLYENGATIASGYQSRFEGGNFEAIGNFSNLCLGFFKNISCPIFKGGIKINFRRASDNDSLCGWSNSTTAAPASGKVVIESFKIMVPLVEYQELYKYQLINELTKLSQENNYKLTLKSWHCIDETNLSGKTFKRNIASTFRNIHNPLFAIVAFQTDALDTQLKKASAFDHCNVKNIWLEIDGKIDWKNEKFSLAYDMYMSYKKTFHKTHQELPLMYLDVNNSTNSRPISVLNLCRQPEKVSGNRNNIILNTEFNEDVPKSTICLISHSEFTYDIVHNTVRKNI